MIVIKVELINSYNHTVGYGKHKHKEREHVSDVGYSTALERKIMKGDVLLSEDQK